MESWGRKKRSIGSDGAKKKSSVEGGKQFGDDMTLSREIVVLDLKEKLGDGAGQSGAPGGSHAPSVGGQNDENLLSADGAGSALKLRSAISKGPMDQAEEGDHSASQSPNDKQSLHCLSSQSLLLLICSIGLFFVLYVCLVAYFFARRDPKISAIRHQYH